MEELLTIQDLIKILKVSRSTIGRMEKAGKIVPAVFMARKKLYRQEDIKKLIDQKKRGGKK